MKRPDYLRRMIALGLGEETLILPDDDDTVEALLSRLRRQATRYRGMDLAFLVSRRDSGVNVKRIGNGKYRKLSPLLNLKVGETIFWSDDLPPEEYKRLYRKLMYILDKKHHALWAERGSDGKVYLRCYMDGDGRVWNEVLRERGETMPMLKIICSPIGRNVR